MAGAGLAGWAGVLARRRLIAAGFLLSIAGGLQALVLLAAFGAALLDAVRR